MQNIPKTDPKPSSSKAPFSPDEDFSSRFKSIDLESDESISLPHLRSISVISDDLSENRSRQIQTAKTGFYSVVPARYVVVAMGFWCWMMFNCLRMTASLTIVAMVNWTDIANANNVTNKPVCDFNRSRNLVDGPFTWDMKMQSAAMSAYFYGLASSQVPGGRWAEKYSAKWVILLGTVSAAITCLLTPPFSYQSYYLLVFLMVVRGVGQGMVVPAFSVLAGKWLPVHERSGLIPICVSGMPFGGFLVLITSGFMCGSPVLGWESVYYFWGGMGMLFSLCWYLWIYDSPIDHPAICHRELFRILSLRTQQAARLAVVPKIPFKEMMTSAPAWGYFLTGFASFWTISLYNIILPTYMGTILQFDLNTNGIMTSLPQLAQCLFLLASSFLCGYLQKNNIYSVNLIRKMSIVVGLTGFTICMVSISFIGCNTVGSVVLLTLALGITGSNFAAVIIVPVDLTPRFAGTMSGMMSVCGGLSGVIIPGIVMLLAGKVKPTLNHWFIVFYISAGLCFFSVIYFVMFGKSEVQPWNYPELMHKSANPRASRPSLLVSPKEKTRNRK